MKIEVTKEFTIESAHKLPQHKGYCKNLHGHSSKIEITISGAINSDGMIMDFSVLKHLVYANIIDKLDHTYLNENTYLPEKIRETPTAENLAVFIFNILSPMLKNNHDITLEKVKYYETKNAYATVRG